MAERRPLTIIAGAIKEVPHGDTLHAPIIVSAKSFMSDSLEELTTGVCRHDADIDFPREVAPSGALMSASAFQLSDIKINQGETVSNFVVYFECNDASSGTTPQLKIRAEALDDATAFAATPNNLTARTKTTAKATWTITDAWSVGVHYPSPDLSAVIQEVVNRPGWAYGNAINIFIELDDGQTDNGNGRSAYDHTNGNYMEYTATSTLADNVIYDGGNTAGRAITIGTVDDYGINIIQNGNVVATIDDTDDFTWNPNKSNAMSFSINNVNGAAIYVPSLGGDMVIGRTDTVNIGIGGASDTDFVVKRLTANGGGNGLAYDCGNDNWTVTCDQFRINADESITFNGNLIIEGTAGLDVNPGSDTDADLITVGVTGAPKLFWDESADQFEATKPIIAIGVFGEFKVTASTTITVSLADTYYQLTGANVSEGVISVVTWSGANYQLIVPDGMYHVTAAVSFSGSTGDTITAAIFANGVEAGNTKVMRKLGAIDVGAIALTGIITGSTGDTFDIRFKNDNTNNITVETCNVSINRIGIPLG